MCNSNLNEVLKCSLVSLLWIKWPILTWEVCVWYGGNRGCCISSVCGLEANVWVAFVWDVTLPCVVPWALWTYSHPEHAAFYFWHCEALSCLPVSNGNGWKGWGNSLGSANLQSIKGGTAELGGLQHRSVSDEGFSFNNWCKAGKQDGEQCSIHQIMLAFSTQNCIPPLGKLGVKADNLSRENTWARWD